MQYPRVVWRLTADEILFHSIEPVLMLMIPIAIVTNKWSIFFLALFLAVVGNIFRHLFFIPGYVIIKRIPVFLSNLIYGRYVT